MSPFTTADLDEANDTEITLGTGKMLALFFGLVMLCAVFFGMGYSMGRNSVRSAPELLASPSPSVSRPSAANQANGSPASAPQNTPDSTQSSAPDNSSSNAANGAAPAPSDQTSTPPPPLPSLGPGYFVQVAAVSKQEDAQALVDALKARQYPAIITNPASDKLFHVQVGPFGDIKDAEGMRAKLVSDGYNPILKK